MSREQIIYWVRSTGYKGKDRVAMYYKGLCNHKDEGLVGYDIKARPTALGRGDYTATYGGDSFETEDGQPWRP